MEAVKGQYEGQINRLQMQLTALHTQLQGMESPSGPGPRISHSTSFTEKSVAMQAAAGSGMGMGMGVVTGGQTERDREREVEKDREKEREREVLERRIRQAEARSVALTQQLQSMPSSLQVR
jgi:hypothetical protein